MERAAGQVRAAFLGSFLVNLFHETTCKTLPYSCPLPSLVKKREEEKDAKCEVIRPRLAAAMADVSKIHVWDLDAAAFCLRDSLAVLAGLVKQYGIKLVVIDPLMAALPADLNAHRDQDVRSVLASQRTFLFLAPSSSTRKPPVPSARVGSAELHVATRVSSGALDMASGADSRIRSKSLERVCFLPALYRETGARWS